MHIYVFISVTLPSIRAFTRDELGANQPSEYAPWRAANGGAAIFLASEDPIL
jgi:hypothetical protein